MAQINATNVHRLEPAWEYHTGDATERSTMYSNPLIVDGVLYAVTPSLKAVALNARWISPVHSPPCSALTIAA